MKKYLIFLIYLLVLGQAACSNTGRSEPLRFERIQKDGSSVFQAQVDSSLVSGSWEYKFRLKQAERVNLVLDIYSAKEGLSIKLVRNRFLFPKIYHCPRSSEKEKFCKLEISNPEEGEYTLVLDITGKENSGPVAYRIFAAVYGLGFASVSWEEEIVRR
ncbi:LIC_10463 family lipoprotein [Leptospira haakeii]|uniref:Lipoprotein n=1 Tax=Leptospira haakeii TaxID=2023198 RepID=A0ABX4PQK5_9LEPT|nr:hypothetical protein [Leptospira haakeii]PKA17171.1 hypothetical protein CH363_00480 [Leptospira haakeii]PKA20895.1 hypothetical protein CH377_00480 [Leptospira haakeii]